MALGPQASASEQGLYPGSPEAAELLLLTAASVSGVTKNGSVVVSLLILFHCLFSDSVESCLSIYVCVPLFLYVSVTLSVICLSVSLSL